jgi:hypothetical protein
VVPNSLADPAAALRRRDDALGGAAEVTTENMTTIRILALGALGD